MEEVSATRLDHCYSAQFAHQGYLTLAINGISPHMYDRDRWMSKAGFQQEGYLREYLKINGEWRDHVMYSLLAADRRS